MLANSDFVSNEIDAGDPQSENHLERNVAKSCD
jgi:hypothetical protein